MAGKTDFYHLKPWEIPLETDAAELIFWDPKTGFTIFRYR